MLLSAKSGTAAFLVEFQLSNERRLLSWKRTVQLKKPGDWYRIYQHSNKAFQLALAHSSKRCEIGRLYYEFSVCGKLGMTMSEWIFQTDAYVREFQA